MGRHHQFSDHLTRSDTSILMTMENLISQAMGPPQINQVNFKLLRTILHILLRHLRIMDKRIQVSVKEVTEYNELNQKLAELQEEAQKGKGKKKVVKPKGEPQSDDDLLYRAKGDKSGKLRQGLKRGKSTGTERSAANLGRKRRYSSDEDDDDDEPRRSRRQLRRSTSRMSSQRKRLNARRRSSSRTMTDRSRDTIRDRDRNRDRERDRDRGLGAKRSYISSQSRKPSVEVVTQDDFLDLEDTVRRLLRRAEPPPAPSMPKNKKLMADVARGTASLTDVMQASQLAKRIGAAEKGLEHMAQMMQAIASSGNLPKELAQSIKETADMGMAVIGRGKRDAYDEDDMDEGRRGGRRDRGGDRRGGGDDEDRRRGRGRTDDEDTGQRKRERAGRDEDYDEDDRGGKGGKLDKKGQKGRDYDDDDRGAKVKQGKGGRDYDDDEKSVKSGKSGRDYDDDDKGGRGKQGKGGRDYDDDDIGARDKKDRRGRDYDDDQKSVKSGKGGRDYDDDDRGPKGKQGKGGRDYDDDKGGRGKQGKGGRDYDDEDDRGGGGGKQGKGGRDYDDDDKGPKGKQGKGGRDYDDDDRRGRGKGKGGRDYDDEDDRGGARGKQAKAGRGYDDDDRGGKGKPGKGGRDYDDDDRGGKGKGGRDYDDEDDRGGGRGKQGKGGRDYDDDDRGGKGKQGKGGRDYDDEDDRGGGRGKQGKGGRDYDDDDRGGKGKQGKGGRDYDDEDERGGGRGKQGKGGRDYDDDDRGGRGKQGKGGRDYDDEDERGGGRGKQGKGGRDYDDDDRAGRGKQGKGGRDYDDEDDKGGGRGKQGKGGRDYDDDDRGGRGKQGKGGRDYDDEGDDYDKGGGRSSMKKGRKTIAGGDDDDYDKKRKVTVDDKGYKSEEDRPRSGARGRSKSIKGKGYASDEGPGRGGQDEAGKKSVPAGPAPGSVEAARLRKGTFTPLTAAQMPCTPNEMVKFLEDLKEHLLKELNKITCNPVVAAEMAVTVSKRMADKQHEVLSIGSRVNKLQSDLEEYSYGIGGYTDGIKKQFVNMKKQIDSTKSELDDGLHRLRTVDLNVEATAIAKLSDRYDDLAGEIESVFTNQDRLAFTHLNINTEIHEMITALEVLRDEKADMSELIHGLRDKVDRDKLTGLLTSEKFKRDMGVVQQNMDLCNETFKKETLYWDDATRELQSSLRDKAEVRELMAHRDRVQQQINNVFDRVKALEELIGDPEVAKLSRRLADGATCGACRVPAIQYPYIRTQQPDDIANTPPHPPDYRKGRCHRWTGGSHTLLGRGEVRRGRPGGAGAGGDPLSRPAVRKGDDGQMYHVDEDLYPCKECNVILPPLKKSSIRIEEKDKLTSRSRASSMYMISQNRIDQIRSKLSVIEIHEERPSRVSISQRRLSRRLTRIHSANFSKIRTSQSEGDLDRLHVVRINEDPVAEFSDDVKLVPTVTEIVPENPEIIPDPEPDTPRTTDTAVTTDTAETPDEPPESVLEKLANDIPENVSEPVTEPQ